MCEFAVQWYIAYICKNKSQQINKWIMSSSRSDFLLSNGILLMSVNKSQQINKWIMSSSRLDFLLSNDIYFTQIEQELTVLEGFGHIVHPLGDQYVCWGINTG